MIGMELTEARYERLGAKRRDVRAFAWPRPYRVRRQLSAPSVGSPAGDPPLVQNRA